MSGLFSIAGKTALVTGGSRGIGLMIARAYVAAGAKVYVSSRKAAACAAAAAELSALGECLALPADVSNMQDIARLGEALREREGRLDILVNNAGAAWGAPFGAFPEQGWDKVMNVNVKGPFFLTQTLLPLLEAAARPDDPARVINIGSVDGLHAPLFENFSYGPSKAAVHQLTRMLAAPLAKKSITVNAIAPGPFATDMMAPMTAKMGDRILGSVPLGRMGGQDDIGGIAICLAARAGAYVTGTVIPVDGGLFAAS
ncbi:MAG TPA: SDR family oxidoreductase [Gammaproteobacteria bacterium]|nr:SDR family oxidoreductase [Gammaproteobacteria bacterium]